MGSILEVIDGRYIVEEEIGSGGMGTVYRTYDRLTRQTVALKQLLVPVDFLEFMSRSASESLRLSLTREFQVLASLRHPNIITVLDYGFAEQQYPFMVMELLENARVITDAAKTHSLNEQINLLLQLLEALAYLHRRQIIHRDLKPSNVLVIEQYVKLLDFGLSLKPGEQDEKAGTLAYIAPEILAGSPANERSDLYAVGVIAYQIIAGKLPFYSPSQEALIEAILSAPLDLTPLNAPPQIVAIIERLLSRQVEERYATAGDVIEALTDAIHIHHEQPSIIRESYLQAAQFVGREAELGQLLTALNNTVNGKGSAWLVGGESGVGKSRLLEELRTRALVTGVQVLRGQAVSGGGLPYQLWREPARRLVITTDVDDFEASVLKEIVPDIGALLLDDGIKTISPDKPRLIRTIVDLFSRQPDPILLILEDLHWTAESLDVLRELNRKVAELPLLVVGSYRDDERPHLPEELPRMELIRLKRLPEEAVAELSVSMLGEAGKQTEVIELLQRETEGNAFFLVEVARALAEAAGGLENIGKTYLPERVFSGGIQEAVRRRLNRAPESARTLLKWAAIIDRHVDLAVLAAITPFNEQEWLLVCADAAILEIHEGRWRFTHDKLRETLLADLDDDEKSVLYRQVAEAIEKVYPDDPLWARLLMDLWHVAGDFEKEARYAYITAREAERVGFLGATRVLAERVIALTDVDPDQFSVLRMKAFNALGQAYTTLGDYAASSVYYQESLTLARRLNDTQGVIMALGGLGYCIFLQGNLNLAQTHWEEALKLAREVGDSEQQGRSLSRMGLVTWLQGGDLDKAAAYHQASLAIWQQLNNRLEIARAYNNLGTIAMQQSQFEAAQEHFEQSLVIKKTIDDRQGIASTFNNLGMLAIKRGHFADAKNYALESIRVCQITGEQWGTLMALITLSDACLRDGDQATALRYLTEAFSIGLNIHAKSQIAQTMTVYIRYCLLEANVETGAELLGLVLYHPSTPSYVLEECRREIYPIFEAQMENLVQVLERGRALDLETTARGILKDLTV